MDSNAEELIDDLDDDLGWRKVRSWRIFTTDDGIRIWPGQYYYQRDRKFLRFSPDPSDSKISLFTETERISALQYTFNTLNGT